MRYIKEQRIDASLAADIATISSMVQIGDTTGYFNVVDVFSKYSAFKTVVNAITV